MLVLSRKSRESVVIGGSGFEPLLKVTVIEISGGKARLGFEADREVAVHRMEVWERIHANGGRDSPPACLAAPVTG